MVKKYFCTIILLILVIIVLRLTTPATSAGSSIQRVNFKNYPLLHGIYVWDIDSYWDNLTKLHEIIPDNTDIYVGYQRYIVDTTMFRKVYNEFNIELVYGEPVDYNNSSVLTYYLNESLRLSVDKLVLDIEFWTIENDFQQALDAYAEALSIARSISQYNGSIYITLTPYIINYSYYDSLAGLLERVRGVHWLCYTNNTETFTYMLSAITSLHNYMENYYNITIEDIVVVNVGGFWNEESIAGNTTLNQFIQLMGEYNISYYGIHDILGYREIVLGENIVGEAEPMDITVLGWADEEYNSYNYLVYQLNESAKDISFTFTICNTIYDNLHNESILWMAGFTLGNSSNHIYVYIGWSYIYGVRLEIYSENYGLIYASTLFHTRYKCLINCTATYTIMYSSGYIKLTYNKIYVKSINLSRMLYSYSIYEIFIHALSSDMSIYKGYIDNIHISINRYSINQGFENNTIDPFTYYEENDDSNPHLGREYLFFTNVEEIPIPVYENTLTTVLAVVIILVTIAKILHRLLKGAY